MANIIDGKIIENKGSESRGYFSGDTFKDFMREVKKYPLLSDNQTRELFTRYKNGDYEAFDLLVNSNLRLVVSFAYQYQNRIAHLQIMDIIQEGTIGLIKAINLYNSDEGKFSTYASTAIKRSILRSIDNQDKTIRKTVHFETTQRKYYYLIEDLQNRGKSIPSDEEICQMLNISMSYLALIKEADNFKTVSLNKKVDDDSDSSELEVFLGNDEKDYEDINIEFDTQRLLVVLKRILSPIQYYVTYYHILFKEDDSLRRIGELLNVTPERVRQIQEKALSIIKPYMNEDSFGFYSIINSYKEQKIAIKDVRTKPIKPQDLVKYLYIRNDLSPMEQKLFYFQLFGDLAYSLALASRELDCSLDEIKKLEISLREKIKIKFQDMNQYSIFTKNILSLYGPQIYDAILNGIDDRDNCETEDISFESSLNQDAHNNFCSRYEIEKDVYLTLFGFKNEFSLSLTKLYKTYIKNTQEFTAEQSLFLECFIFSKKPKKVFEEEYPSSGLYHNHKFLILKLEMLYYDIKNLFANSFTKENYLRVKIKFAQYISERRIMLLDLYFGVSGEVLSISEIAIKLGEDCDKLKGEIFSAIEYLKGLYSNNSRGLIINGDLYKNYVIDKKYDLTDETRLALKYLLFDKLDYGQIAEKLGLTRGRVANIVNDGLRKIDYYRFGIISIDIVDEQLLADFFVSEFSNFSVEEKQIIYAKKCELKSNSDICQRYSISQDKLTKLLMKFNAAFMNFRIRNVVINEADIYEEVSKPVYDSVISDEEKKILSLFYGFKNEHNQDGIKLNKSDIAKLLKRDLGTISDKINRSLNNIRARKILLIRPDLVYMDINKLDKALNDKHLPISVEQRNIICSLLGLKNYPPQKMEDLASEYNVDAKSIKRQYQRAIISVCKYLNHEIEGILDYEEDILPYLKYFSRRDVTFITACYKERLTNQQIADKYNVKVSYVNERLQELKNILANLMNGDIEKRINFECYRELIDSPNLPFYGNLELAKKCFELYTGESTYENVSIPNIIHLLNLSCSEETVRRYIYLLVLSIYRLKNGVKKHISFTDEEVCAYYLHHQSEMNLHRREIYLRTMNSVRSEFLSSNDDLSDTIIFDLLKEQNPDIFNLDIVSREEVIGILKKYYKLLKTSVKETLMRLFCINEPEFMSKTELKRTLKLRNQVILNED